MKVLAALLAAMVAPVSVSSTLLEARFEAIAELGEMNGVALQCGYIDQVRRMKRAVVATAPKERSFGLAFDQATNGSFIAFTQQRLACPGKTGFRLQVGERIEDMRQAFDTDTETDARE